MTVIAIMEIKPSVASILIAPCKYDSKSMTLKVAQALSGSLKTNFRGKKLNLSDFGHYYRADQYFTNGEADIAQVGTDVYSLCGMASTNLALNVR